MVSEENVVGNSLSSLGWAIENQVRKEIPDLDKLNLPSIALGKSAGIYTLVDTQDRRAYLTIEECGKTKIWNLEYDPEYLNEPLI